MVMQGEVERMAKNVPSADLKLSQLSQGIIDWPYN